MTKRTTQEILCGETYETIEEMIATAKSVCGPLEEIHIHDYECAIDGPDEECTCEPHIITAEARAKA